MPIAPLTKQELEELGWDFAQTYKPDYYEVTSHASRVFSNPVPSGYALKDVRLAIKGSAGCGIAFLQGLDIRFDKDNDDFKNNPIGITAFGVNFNRVHSFSRRFDDGVVRNIIVYAGFTPALGNTIYDDCSDEDVDVEFKQDFYMTRIGVGNPGALGHFFVVYSDSDREKGQVSVSQIITANTTTRLCSEI